MSTPFPASLLSLALVLGLASCASKNEGATPTYDGLEGNWHLVQRQCYCAPAPTPNETVTFTASNFWFFKNGQPTSSGTYTAISATTCGLSGPAPGLRLADSILGTHEARVILRGDSLVLDYGSPCDAPRDTYVQ